MMMEWGAPKNFVWLWVLPMTIGIFYMASGRKRAWMSRFGDLKLVEKLVLSFDPGKRLAKRILLAAATACLVLALCQPHFRKREILVERRGVDVLIAVDVSWSMMAKDIPSHTHKGLKRRTREFRGF